MTALTLILNLLAAFRNVAHWAAVAGVVILGVVVAVVALEFAVSAWCWRMRRGL